MTRIFVTEVNWEKGTDKWIEILHFYALKSFATQNTRLLGYSNNNNPSGTWNDGSLFPCSIQHRLGFSDLATHQERDCPNDATID